MAETSVRLFIAIPVDPAVDRELNRIQATLRRNLPARALRWVKPGLRHLTLRFLGDTPRELLPLLQTALERCSAFPPFSLPLTRLGAFPAPHRPRILWLGLDDRAGHCRDLHRTLSQALAESGFAEEVQRFIPHLTLGRVKARLDPRRIDWEPAVAGIALEVSRVELIASELTPAGPVYRCLKQVQLIGESGKDSREKS